MTDIHADGPAEDVTRPADRADIDRLDGRIDRSVDAMRAEARADRAETRAEARADRAETRAEIVGLRKDLSRLERVQWTTAGAVALAVAVFRFWPGG